IVACPFHVILEPPLTTIEIREREPDEALALIGSVVHGHQQPLIPWTLPGIGQEAVRGPVTLPGRQALEQLPLALADDRLSQHGEQEIIEARQLRLGSLDRASNQMRRGSLPSSFELSLVEEAKTRR